MGRLTQVLDRVRDVHVEQPGRVVQALHVIGEANTAGPFGVS